MASLYDSSYWDLNVRSFRRAVFVTGMFVSVIVYPFPSKHYKYSGFRKLYGSGLRSSIRNGNQHRDRRRNPHRRPQPSLDGSARVGHRGRTNGGHVGTRGRRMNYEPQPSGPPVCDDPTHDEYCDCGARPDHEYERRIEDER